MVKWNEFEEPLEAFMKWFRQMEAIFRDQPLQSDLEGKISQADSFKMKRDAIVKREKEIDQFVDKSHSLVNTSGVERIKPLVSQISNKYILFLLL